MPSGGGAVGVHAVIFGSMDIVNYYADLGIEDDHADEVGYWCYWVRSFVFFSCTQVPKTNEPRKPFLKISDWKMGSYYLPMEL